MPTMQKPAQRGKDTFPQNKEEIAKARANLVKSIHIPQIQKRIVAVMQGNPQGVVPGLSEVIAQVIGRVVTSIKGKFGSKIHIKLIMMLIKLAVDEIDAIAKGVGVGAMPKQIKQQIAQNVGNMLDEILKKGKQGQPQQGQPQQGMPPQGQTQGPPQGMQAPQQPNPNAPPLEGGGLLGGQ